MDCTIRVAKTKALTSFTVTAKLICTFVFAYADCWFPQEAAHMFVSFYLFLNALHPWSTAMVMLGRSVVSELAS